MLATLSVRFISAILFFFLPTPRPPLPSFFFFNDPAPPEISPLPLPDALPIPPPPPGPRWRAAAAPAPGGIPRTSARPRSRAAATARRVSVRRVDRPPPVNATQDRKSTRLNSSHLVISYAVFCLKKKKIKQSITDLRDRQRVTSHLQRRIRY